MIIDDELLRCIHTFRGAFINSSGEIILDSRTNSYFSLKNVQTPEDIKAKVLENLSRACCKTQRYSYKKRNQDMHKDNLSKLNEFLGPSFTIDDMYEIYTYLGNGVNHNLTLRFIRSNYDMSLLSLKRLFEEE